MTKAEIVKLVKERTGLSRSQALVAVDTFLNNIKDALRRGERVCLVGLGTFYVKHRRKREGRNPKTGEKITVPEKKVVAFRAGKEFRQLVK
ncbi:MAG: integration host factor subunit beta [Candidatus Sumerlaeia bacterium]|nr:integration host factor subunit beta [Candidatus Sumerlaeia bacterium]